MPRLILSFFFCLLCLSSLGAKKKEKLPIWIISPSSVYSENDYVVELGTGSSQKEADNKAIEGLAAIFNRSVSSKTDSSLAYRENADNVDKTKSINQHVSVLTSMKDLIGVEIKERWKSKDGVFYALAVLNKQKAITIYSEKLDYCISLIDEALNIPSNEKGTFQEYTRYVFATSEANEMSLYNAYLAVLNPAGVMIYSEDIYKAENLKLKAMSIAKNILVEVRIGGNWTDKRIKSIFEKVFTSRGFTITKGKKARYVLDVKLELGEETKLSDDRLMIRYSLNSELLDTATGDSFLPFVLNDKAVQFNSEAVKNQIFKNIKTKVEKDFDTLFNQYIENFSLVR
ncbi:MAG: LPP20 family lipoprotein [Treponema sp.]